MCRGTGSLEVVASSDGDDLETDLLQVLPWEDPMGRGGRVSDELA